MRITKKYLSIVCMALAVVMTMSVFFTANPVKAESTTNIPYYIGKATVKGFKGTVKYTGKPVKQNVTIYYNKVKLVNGKDYSISYKNNVEAGAAKMFIDFKGAYDKKLKDSSMNFFILAPKPRVTNHSAKKNSITLQWKNSTHGRVLDQMCFKR